MTLPTTLQLHEALTFSNVALAYGDAGRTALSCIDLTLPAHKTTALVGDSGSGKTTLEDIALGLLPATSGRVDIDGLSLSDINTRHRWRQSVAYAAQDAYLIPGSIRDNLCWLSGPQSDEAIGVALHQADAAAFVQTLTAGLNHILGERGEGISGGERQRIAIARTLLCRPQMLVLDEVTSHLDPQSERRVLAALDRLRGRVTILMVAHREEAQRHPDHIVALDKGRVVQINMM